MENKSKPKDVTASQFGFSTVTLQEEISQSRFDVLKARREECAREFGLEIVNKKGWDMTPEGDRVVTTFRVYVLKPMELRRLLIDARKDELEKISYKEFSYAEDLERYIDERLEYLDND